MQNIQCYDVIENMLDGNYKQYTFLLIDLFIFLLPNKKKKINTLITNQDE